MVGTSAIRSPAARHSRTWRRRLAGVDARFNPSAFMELPNSPAHCARAAKLAKEDVEINRRDEPACRRARRSPPEGSDGGNHAARTRTRMTDRTKLPLSPSEEVARFLKEVDARPPAVTEGHGRLIFGLDATMSRQPTWDLACQLQAEMFEAAAATGGLAIQLVYYRGLGECRASPWMDDARKLGTMMARIDCQGGRTQIRRVLRHAAREAGEAPVSALVFVGDAMEETLDQLCAEAGPLALRGVPDLHVPGRAGPGRGARLPRDRPADQRCMVPLRCRRRGGAARAAARGRGLCGRRRQGACGAGEVR